MHLLAGLWEVKKVSFPILAQRGEAQTVVWSVSPDRAEGGRRHKEGGSSPR